MTTLVLIVLFSGLALLLADGNWRGGVIFSLLIGFLQDPLRKLTPGQPSLFVGLVLIAIASCCLVLLNRRDHFSIKTMFWGSPLLAEWAPIYLYLIVFQGLNSLVRYGNPLLSVIGVAFYFAPAFGVWLGFQIGIAPRLLRRLLFFYLIVSAIFAFSVFLSYRGWSHPLLKEVGSGILINFRYGFEAQGASGLWRTSEIAAWQLAAASCLSFSVALSLRDSSSTIGLMMSSMAFSLVALFTGRRKSLVLVVLFLGLYLLLFSRRSTAASREQLITAVLGAAGIGYAIYSLLLVSELGANFNEYTSRAATGFGDISSRFNAFAVGGVGTALEVAQGIGLGAGAISQTGNLRLEGLQKTSQMSFISESGSGKIIAELGLPGLLVLLVIFLLLAKTFWQNFLLMRLLPPQIFNLYVGLLAFSLANIPFFLTASQVYGDPFVLIILSLCLGSNLAMPVLVHAFQERQLAQLSVSASVSAAGVE
ncbi:MAG: hypothetical protein WCH37_00810 [Synechococcaceae cyanobacterium ELA182]